MNEIDRVGGILNVGLGLKPPGTIEEQLQKVKDAQTQSCNYMQVVGEPIIYDRVRKGLKGYEEFVDNVWHGDPNDPKALRDLYIMTAGLGGETGEVLEKLKKHVRDGNINTNQLKKELGDVLYYLTKIAHHYDMTLADVLIQNVEKLSDRMNRGTMHGNGDDR